ncbi:MAG: DsbA family oxidoreductase [Muribaculaceae bacterium]|nr:DsbA family oxidoreductase [Muribaculaceae bacterium]
MKTITIWSDYACPYCYIGERRLKDAVKELGVEEAIRFEYRAFELNPNAPIKPEAGTTAERLAAKYGISVEQAKKNIENIDKLAKEIGINMKFEGVKSTNTLDAHRLMKFAQTTYEPAIYEALNEALFKAYFVEGKSLADRKLLLNIAESVAMDPIQSKDVLESDLYTNDVRYDEQEAHMRGVSGVPYMVFDGEFAVPGAISTEDCKHALRDLLGGVKEKPQGLHGAECDETGCKVG